MTATHPTLPCRICTKAILPSTSRKTEGLCLDCYYEEMHRKEREARESNPGCAACDGSSKAIVCSFDWPRAVAGEGEYRKYPRYLERERAVKGGERYHCTRCAAVWYLRNTPRGPQRGLRMRLIAAPFVSLFSLWSTRRAVCPERILEVAYRIGGAPVGPYCDGQDAVWIPCRVTTRQGERIDLAALRFSDEPPIPSGDDRPEKLDRYRLIDDVADIVASRLALPRGVRRYASQMIELRMGFRPTAVKSKSGKSYVLNGPQLFFDRDGIAGEDLHLARPDRDAPLINDAHGPIIVFAADWFDAADAMRLLVNPLNPLAATTSWLRWTLRERRT